MTDDERRFHTEVIRDPSNMTARLAYADWLAENGQEWRSRFIIGQIQAAKRDRYLTDSAMATRKDKFGTLDNLVNEAWIQPPQTLMKRVTIPATFSVGNTGWTRLTWRNGFVYKVDSTLASILKNRDMLLLFPVEVYDIRPLDYGQCRHFLNGYARKLRNGFNDVYGYDLGVWLLKHHKASLEASQRFQRTIQELVDGLAPEE